MVSEEKLKFISYESEMWSASVIEHMILIFMPAANYKHHVTSLDIESGYDTSIKAKSGTKNKRSNKKDDSSASILHNDDRKIIFRWFFTIF